MAKFKSSKSAVNLSKGNMGKGSHSHIVVDLDGSTFASGDKISTVVDTGRGLTFSVKSSKPKNGDTRIWAKIRNTTPAKVKDTTSPPDGTLTVTLTVNSVPACNMIPVNYITEDNACDS